MKPTVLTCEVLAYKILNRNLDEDWAKWVDWAVNMLIQGFDTEYLVILAGMNKPYDQFEMQSITEKALHELGLDYSSADTIIYQYVCYLIKNSIDSLDTLNTIKDVYFELDTPPSLQNFYLLYEAKVDLLDSENQWYIEGLNRNNVDQTIVEYFATWPLEYADKKIVHTNWNNMDVEDIIAVSEDQTIVMNEEPVLAVSNREILIKENDSLTDLKPAKSWWQRLFG